MPIQFKPSLSTRIAACAIAAVAAASVLAIGGYLIGGLESARLRSTNTEAVNRIEKSNAEARNLLRRARSEVEPNCSENSLIELRKMLVTAEFNAQFSVLGPEGELLCTTTVSKVDPPLPYPKPSATFIAEGDTYDVFINFPLRTGNVGVKTTVMRLGNFAVSNSPAEVENTYKTGVDEIQMQHSDGRITTIFASDQLRTIHQQGGQPGTVHRWTKADGALHWDAATQALAVTSVAKGGLVFTKSISPVSEVLSRYLAVAVAIGGLSLLVMILAYTASLPVLVSRRMLSNRLHTVLRPENVICMLQPIIDLRTGATAGCEVLMRLESGGCILQPNDVIPAVMAKKLTSQFDAAVITRAARDIATLPFPEDFKISVNFFPNSFKGGLAQELLQQHFAPLRERGVRVCVEVIEQDASSDVMNELKSLREAGYELSVDDFGTGFSNLGTVRKMSPAYLKIDRSFVHDMEDDTVRAALIPEIIAIARAVKADVVAEGIENEAQAERLKAMGAEYGQGYFFAKPMRIDAFREWLEKESGYTPESPAMTH